MGNLTVGAIRDACLESPSLWPQPESLSRPISAEYVGKPVMKFTSCDIYKTQRTQD